MRNMVFYIWTSLCLAGIVVVLMPTELLPDSLTPFTSAQGKFTGKAIEIPVRKSNQQTVKAEIIIRMEDGDCAVSSIGPEGEGQLFRAVKVNYLEARRQFGCSVVGAATLGSNVLADDQKSNATSSHRLQHLQMHRLARQSATRQNKPWPKVRWQSGWRWNWLSTNQTSSTSPNRRAKKLPKKLLNMLGHESRPFPQRWQLAGNAA